MARVTRRSWHSNGPGTHWAAFQHSFAKVPALSRPGQCQLSDSRAWVQCLGTDVACSSAAASDSGHPIMIRDLADWTWSRSRCQPPPPGRRTEGSWPQKQLTHDRRARPAGLRLSDFQWQVQSQSLCHRARPGCGSQGWQWTRGGSPLSVSALAVDSGEVFFPCKFYFS